MRRSQQLNRIPKKVLDEVRPFYSVLDVLPLALLTLLSSSSFLLARSSTRARRVSAASSSARSEPPRRTLSSLADLALVLSQYPASPLYTCHPDPLSLSLFSSSFCATLCVLSCPSWDPVERGGSRRVCARRHRQWGSVPRERPRRAGARAAPSSKGRASPSDETEPDEAVQEGGNGPAQRGSGTASVPPLSLPFSLPLAPSSLLVHGSSSEKHTRTAQAALDHQHSPANAAASSSPTLAHEKAAPPQQQQQQQQQHYQMQHQQAPVYEQPHGAAPMSLHHGAPPAANAAQPGHERPWSTGLCSCGKDVPGFCLAFWCPCMAYGRMSTLLADSPRPPADEEPPLTCSPPSPPSHLLPRSQSTRSATTISPRPAAQSPRSKSVRARLPLHGADM